MSLMTTAIVSFIAGAMSSKLVEIVSKSLADLVKKGHSVIEEIQDPELKTLIKDAANTNVRLVEYLIPDRGKGAEKFDWVDSQLARIPALAVAPILRKKIIETACQIMWSADDAGKEFIKKS